MAAIAAGTDRINRVGRMARIRSVELRFLPTFIATSGAEQDAWRVLLVRLRSVDPLTSASSFTTNMFPIGDSCTAIPDADDVAEVYFDKAGIISSTRALSATIPGETTNTYVHEMAKMNVPVSFSNTGAANVSSNQIVLCAYSARGQIAASASVRVFFEDD